MVRKNYFQYAITRRPCKRITEGLTTAVLGKPDYRKALHQHDVYINALKTCGLHVKVLKADENYPDSVFVEDPALTMDDFAVVTNPGAPSRKGETRSIRRALEQFYPPQKIYTISDPGTLEGGDVMTVRRHCYIGISGRTNEAGAKQLIEILEENEMTGSTIPVQEVLHLKTGLTYLDNNHLLAAGKFTDQPAFGQFNVTAVDSANCLWINGEVLVIEGIPETRDKIEELGYRTIEIPFSEYLKIDGGLGCLSLRF